MSILRCLFLLTVLSLSPAIALRAADGNAPVPAPAAEPAVKKPNVAEARFWEAVALLRKTDPAEQARGRAALESAAEMEFTPAQALYADCLMSGAFGFDKNKRKAANLYRLAAERGNAFAQVSLGLCYAAGTGVWKSEDKAVTWLTAALDPKADFSESEPPAGVAEPADATPSSAGAAVAGKLLQDHDPVLKSQATAHYVLGQILFRRKKFAEAQAHFVAAATAGENGRNGLYRAAVAAALNYALGQGGPRDSAKADAMLAHSRELVARAGVSMIHNYVDLKIVDDFAVADLDEDVAGAAGEIEAQIQSGIGDTFADRKSKDYNPREAEKWYKLAAANGESWAMLALANLYAGNELGPPDLTQAFHWFEQIGEGKKPRSMLGAINLAICLENGLGTPKDEARAAVIFRRFRDFQTVCYLGTIGQCPTHILTADEVGQLTETWAKQKKDPQAQYIYAVSMLNDSPPDFDGGIRWLERAAKANNGPAFSRLGGLHDLMPWVFFDTRIPENQQKAADYYRRGAEAGVIEGLLGYAKYLADGTAVKRDPDLAERMYLKALEIDPTHGRARLSLGQLYLKRGKEARKDGRAAEADKWCALGIKQLEDAAGIGNAKSALKLGWIYHDGEVVPKDLRRAYGFFDQASAKLPEGHYGLGLMLEQGEGVPASGPEAAYHYRLAALDGHDESLRRLINLYLGGQTGAVDLERALYWLNLFISRGQVHAIPAICDILIKRGEYDTVLSTLKAIEDSKDRYISGYANDRLAYLYAQGLGVKRNPDKAKRYAAQAVEYGNGDALTELGKEQVAAGRDAEGIATLRRAAATSGRACFTLGQLLYYGTHVAPDQKEAVVFLRKAAEKSDPDAMLFLASMTYKKIAGAPPLAEGLQLARQAEILGHPKARKLRESLEQRLNRETAAPEESGRVRSS